MQKLRHYAKHLMIFGASKSAVLFAPLIAASVLSSKNYGLMEWSLSSSIMLGLVLSLGAGGVIAFEIIKHEKSALVSTAMSYAAYTSLLLGILGLVGIALQIPRHLFFIFGFSGIFVAQFSLSAYMKAKGMGAYASFIDSFIYILILFSVLAAIPYREQSMQLTALFPIFATLFSAILFYLNDYKLSITLQELLDFLKKGFPIMVSSFLAIAFLNLPRVLLGSFESFAAVADFSLYFRWAAIALIVYQFLLVVNFRKIYSLGYEKLDRYIASVSFFVYLVGFIIIGGLLFLGGFDMFSHIARPDHDFLIQSIMASTISMWALSASLEGVFYREHLTKYQIYASLLGIVVFLVNVFLLKFFFFSETVLIYSLSWLTAYAVVTVFQLLALKRHTAPFIKTKFFIAMLFFLETIIFYLDTQ